MDTRRQRWHLMTAALLVALSASANSAAAQKTGKCQPGSAFADLDVGNVRARVFSNGAIAWNRCGPVFEAPKGSGRNPLFAASLWIGGMVGGELRMSAATYSDWEMWPGPLDENGEAPADATPYDRVFSVYDEDIRKYNETGSATADMLDWPWGLGAPVFDGDGIPDNYDVAAGDRPYVFGDQTLWWVMNDRGGKHMTTKTAPLGLEVRVTAFAGSRPEGLWSSGTTFYRYELIYRGSEPLEDAYVGLYADPDLGHSGDDYIGCDTVAGLGYVYNADDFDEGDKGYGSRPPALGFSFIQRPVVDTDGRDNDLDGETDEPGEQLRMTAFGLYDPYYVFGDSGRPDYAHGFYGMLKGFFAIPCWMFCPGGFYPSLMYPSLPPQIGSEENIDGNGSRNEPGDRRFVMASGPFRMEPGDIQAFILAIIFSQGNDRLDSVYRLLGAPASLRNALPYVMKFDTTSTAPSPPPPELPARLPDFSLSHYPLPASDIVFLDFELPSEIPARIFIYNSLGQHVATVVDGIFGPGKEQASFGVGDLPAGTYFYRLETAHYSNTRTLTIAR